MSSISLNKYISDTGYCSRREADRLIEAGRVLLNNEIAVTGNRYAPGDEVVVDGSILEPLPKEKKVILAFNKPTGITTTTDINIPGNIISFIHYPKRIFPIGRLDKDSQGLIFLTNDGDLVNKILRAGNNHEKEYAVRVHKPIDGLIALGKWRHLSEPEILQLERSIKESSNEKKPVKTLQQKVAKVKKEMEYKEKKMVSAEKKKSKTYREFRRSGKKK